MSYGPNHKETSGNAFFSLAQGSYWFRRDQEEAERLTDHQIPAMQGRASALAFFSVGWMTGDGA